MQKLLYLAIFCGALIANEDANMKQELVKFQTLANFKGDAKIFSGKVKVQEMFKTNAWQSFSGGLVEFSPSARSAWHIHPAGQTLIVTKGIIITGTENGEVHLAKEGDVILCPPNVKHWHGASDKESGTHCLNAF